MKKLYVFSSSEECSIATTPESQHPDPLALGFRHVILALFCLPLVLLRCTWIATNCNVFCICLQARISSPSTNPPSPCRQPILCCFYVLHIRTMLCSFGECQGSILADETCACYGRDAGVD
ncbi:unnamed protein product [Sphagnum jensenii]|uniref:Uncharacterized protein n=1 Tax=Sphagnum jensenii TaxID=128206 RepID=A0ABP0WJE6_9BRYO